MPKINGKLRDGNYLIKEAKKAGLRVENGKGDHVKVYAPEERGYMIIPSREMGTGLAASVVKWLIAAGVTLAIICAIFTQF